MTSKIISIENTKLEFHKDNLELILKKIPLDIPITILSIIGPFRTGKSMLMNIFLDKLINNKELSISNSHGIHKYFESEYGTESVTKGILAYNEPLYSIINDKKTAIILLDYSWII